MDRYKKYSAKEFLDELLTNYNEELKSYNKLKKDITNISNIKEMLSSGPAFALIEDIMNNYPSLLTTYKGLFNKYIEASTALYVLTNYYK